MPRFEFDQNPDSGDKVDYGIRIFNLIVRGFGVVLLIIGMIVALMVITSAWSLYDDPVKIEDFARAIEHGSNLDLTLSSAKNAGREQLETEPVENGAAPQPAATPAPEFRFSYFIAWLIALLLLMLIGRLSIAAVRTGGELALYDVQVKKLARALLDERARID